MNHHVAWLLTIAGRDTTKPLNRSVRRSKMDPEFPPAHSVLAAAYEAKNMHPEALEEVRRLSARSSGRFSSLADLAYIHARSAERSRAVRELDQLKALSKHNYVPSFDFAAAYFALGDKDQGFLCLEKAREERSSYLPWLKVSARWVPLRSDRRFSDFLRRLTR